MRILVGVIALALAAPGCSFLFDPSGTENDGGIDEDDGSDPDDGGAAAATVEMIVDYEERRGIKLGAGAEWLAIGSHRYSVDSAEQVRLEFHRYDQDVGPPPEQFTLQGVPSHVAAVQASADTVLVSLSWNGNLRAGIATVASTGEETAVVRWNARQVELVQRLANPMATDTCSAVDGDNADGSGSVLVHQTNGGCSASTMPGAHVFSLTAVEVTAVIAADQPATGGVLDRMGDPLVVFNLKGEATVNNAASTRTFNPPAASYLAVSSSMDPAQEIAPAVGSDLSAEGLIALTPEAVAIAANLDGTFNGETSRGTDLLLIGVDGASMTFAIKHGGEGDEVAHAITKRESGFAVAGVANGGFGIDGGDEDVADGTVWVASFNEAGQLDSRGTILIGGSAASSGNTRVLDLVEADDKLFVAFETDYAFTIDGAMHGEDGTLHSFVVAITDTAP